MSCFCSIIPPEVFRRLSKDTKLPADLRAGFADAAAIGNQMRQLREQARKLTSLTSALMPGQAELAP
ncbi:MAG: hypothetical protein ACM3YM_11450, partial [Sphingomonadales bacterium]